MTFNKILVLIFCQCIAYAYSNGPLLHHSSAYFGATQPLHQMLTISASSLPSPALASVQSLSELPFNADGSIYHLGLVPSQLANRIVTVGDIHRAHLLGGLLENTSVHTSPRQFTVITGLWKALPISIVSIGMGYPNMDIFIREARAVTQGTLWIIRLGTCGSLTPSIRLGSFVVPALGCTRAIMGIEEREELLISPSCIYPNPNLTKALMNNLPLCHSTKHCSSDTFYYSQGRHSDDFHGDAGEVREKFNDFGIQTLEMETFWLLYFAQRCKSQKGAIKASAVMIVVANRERGEFLVDKKEVERLEIEAGTACFNSFLIERES